MLSDQALIRFRQTLHQHPELSDQEDATAARIKNLFAGFAPDETLEKSAATDSLSVLMTKNQAQQH